MLRRIVTVASHPLLPPSSTGRPIANSLGNLARWLQQIQHDATGFSFERLIKETKYSVLFWRMYLAGQERRLYASYDLNASARHPVAPDPHGPIAWKWRDFIGQVCASLEVEPLIATYGNHARQVADDLTHSTKRRIGIWAWMNTYMERHAPELLTIQDSDVPLLLYRLPTEHWIELPLWVFQAASCLGIFERNYGLYTGMGAPGERILPPDPVFEPLWTPILHNYAKGLLNLGRECPRGFGCSCNTVVAITDQPPPAHPEETGALPPLRDPREDEIMRTYRSGGPAHNGHNGNHSRPLTDQEREHN